MQSDVQNFTGYNFQQKLPPSFLGTFLKLNADFWEIVYNI